MAKKKHRQPLITPITPDNNQVNTTGTTASAQTPHTQVSNSVACIIPSFLYLAPVSSTSAKSTPALSEALGITHVLSIGKSPLSHSEGITYLRLSLLDSEDADIIPVIEKACEFIDTVEKEPSGKVLVHCSAAISRSPAVVVGYLINRRGMRMQEALGVVKGARRVVAPNKGFLGQLEGMESHLFGEGAMEEG
ncbi:phosphatases II [Cladorrhinum sp. PSN259]|nr:phosphatases II [Cladorrhinum sp. PSN259]